MPDHDSEASGTPDDDWELEAMNSGREPDGPGGLRLIPDAALEHRRGRPPRMAYRQWTASQGLQLGATAVNDWYWRCPVCHVWAGPAGILAAQRAGMDHRHDAHDGPATLRTEARKAARRVCKDMTAARLDDITSRLAAAHRLPAGTVHMAIRRTAIAIEGLRSSCDEVLFYTGKDLGTARNGDYGAAPHSRVRALVSAIAVELGHRGWLENMMISRGR